MPAIWHKPGYLPHELDPLTRVPLPGAIPPGFYCEDQAAFDALLSAPDLERTAGAMVVGAVAVRIATPEQVTALEAIEGGAPSETEALAEISEKITRVQWLMERDAKISERDKRLMRGP